MQSLFLATKVYQTYIELQLSFNDKYILFMPSEHVYENSLHIILEQLTSFSII